MTDRILLIGQAPGPNTKVDFPLYPYPNNSAGARLQRLTGLTRAEYLSAFDRVNLLPYFPGQWSKEDRFPMSQARLAAAVMSPLLSGRTVVVLEAYTAKAFGLKVGFHEWVDVQAARGCPISKRDGLARVAVAPHTSGLSRWYNDPGNQAEARAFWEELVGGWKKDHRNENKALSFNSRERIS